MIKCLLISVGCAVVLAIVIGVPLGLLLPKTQQFRAGFLDRCENYGSRNDCPDILAEFEKAYVGKSACEVPVEAYDPLMKLVPFNHQCNKTMLWSDTNNLIRQYTQHKQCFTLEASLLGSTLDRQRWCSKEGSKETFVTMCEGYGGCEKNPVRSFWDRASAAFAEFACSEVVVLLDGSKEKPFEPQDPFGRVELPRLSPPNVTHLTVILVTGDGSNCNSPNLGELQQALKPGITYTCKDVPKKKVVECAANPNAGCAECLKA